MRQLAIHRHHVRCVAYSPDGRFVATASNDRSAQLLDAATGEVVASWAVGLSVLQAVAFSPDGRSLAFAGQEQALWVADVAITFELTRRSVRRDEGPHAYPIHVTALAYTPDGRHLLLGTGDRILGSAPGMLRVWGASTLEEEREVSIPGGVQSLAVRPDGQQVALGTGLGWLHVTVSDWGQTGQYSRGRCGMAVAYSADGRLLAVASGWAVVVMTPTGDHVRALAGHRGKVTSLAFTPQGRLLSGSWDRTVRVWQPETGVQLASFDWGRGKVQYVAVAPDGMTAAAAMDKGVVVWDLDD